MKPIKLIGCLLLLAIISTSCFDEWFNHEPKIYSTRVALSFQDTLGNDLISGIEFTQCYPSLNLCEIRNRDVFLLSNEYSVSIQKYGDYYCVNLNLGVDKKRDTFPNKITFTLRSPYVFGDNDFHSIDTYWERQNCSRIEYSGKEFPVEESQIATIILDRQ